MSCSCPLNPLIQPSHLSSSLCISALEGIWQTLYNTVVKGTLQLSRTHACHGILKQLTARNAISPFYHYVSMCATGSYGHSRTFQRAEEFDREAAFDSYLQYLLVESHIPNRTSA